MSDARALLVEVSRAIAATSTDPKAAGAIEALCVCIEEEGAALSDIERKLDHLAQPTEAMISAGIPWLTHIHHMRATDRREALSAAFSAMLAKARA